MAKSNDHKPVDRATTTLGRETDFRGTMRFKESLRIEGKFTGEIESPGFLAIAEGAVVHANIRVSSIVVGGIVYGNIEASGKLEMLTTGRVFGDIKTAKLKIADGVVYEGRCEMIKNPEKVDVFGAPPHEIKKTAQSA
jgi:cytoskeletal protein CcmA (bactofilin family)